MRLLIAGWHGQVARALVELAPARSEITAMSIGLPAFELCRGSNMRSTLATAEPDILINTAAYTEVDDAEREPAAVFDLNRAGAGEFAAVAAKKGIPVIHLSSGYVFDGNKDGAYVEDDAPDPQSVYGRSKLAGEQAVAAANPRHVILRTSWVFSATGRNFVPSILDQAASRKEIEVVDDQVGSPTYAAHLASAILDLAEKVATAGGETPWGVYHMAAGGGGVSWRGLAEAVFEVSRAQGGPSATVRPISSADYPTAAPRPRNAQLDGTRLRDAFGITLPDWRDGVEACVTRLLAERAHAA